MNGKSKAATKKNAAATAAAATKQTKAGSSKL
jgi:hypothetical protein